MTDQEFVDFLNDLWPSENPEEDERLWQEDFDRRHQEWLEDEEDLLADLEDYAPDQIEEDLE